MSKILSVELTDEQYSRYRDGFSKLHGLEDPATDEQLIAQLKREASAITCAAEVGHGQPDDWSF